MLICPNESCKKTYPNGTKFCTNCGTALVQENIQPSSNDNQTSQDNNTQGNATSPLPQKTKINNKSPKNKIIFITLAVLVVAIFIAYYILNSTINNKEELSQTLKGASKRNSVDELVTAINFDGFPKEEVETHKNFLESEEDISSLADRLKSSIDDLDKRKKGDSITITSVTDSTKYEVFKNKKLFFFKHYEIKPVPVDVKIHTTYPEVTLTLNNKDYKLNKNQKAITQPFLPGEYDYKIKATTIFKESNTEDVVTISFNDSNELIADPKTYDVVVDDDNYYYDYKKLTYLVNGKEVKFNDLFSEDNVIKVPVDISFDLAAKMKVDGKEITSNKITINENFSDFIIFEFQGIENYSNSGSEVVPEDDYDYSQEIISLLEEFYYIHTSGEPEELTRVIYSGSDFLKQHMETMRRYDREGIKVKLLKYDNGRITKVNSTKYTFKVDEYYEITSSKGTREQKQETIYDIIIDDGQPYINNLSIPKK